MAKDMETANIIMYLKYMRNDLYYCIDDPNGTYAPLEEDTTTGVEGGWIVQWQCADSSIEQIMNINVNTNKPGMAVNWKDIWADKPKKVNNEGTIFQGTVDPGTPDPQEFNGYTIHYKTSSGEKYKDPVFKNPPAP